MKYFLRISLFAFLIFSGCKTHHASDTSPDLSNKNNTSTTGTPQSVSNCPDFVKSTDKPATDCGTVSLDPSSSLYLFQSQQTSNSLGLADSTSNSSQNQNSGLSTGAIVGIVSAVGVVSMIAVGGGIGVRYAISARNQAADTKLQGVKDLGDSGAVSYTPEAHSAEIEPSLPRDAQPAAPIKIAPDAITPVAKDTFEVDSSKVFGPNVTGKTSIKIVNNLDSVPLNDWSKPQLVAFKQGDLFKDNAYVQALVSGKLKAPVVITDGNFQYTFLGVSDGYVLVKVTKGLPQSAQTLHTLFPDFEPQKALGGGITGDVFLGTREGEEVVAKRLPRNEYDAFSAMLYSGWIVPVKRMNWVQTGPQSFEYGVIMEKAKGDAQHAIADGSFNRNEFNFFARDASAAILAMHQRGWAHMDLKPENFLQLPNGRYVLSDFGSSLPLGVHQVVNSDPKYADPWRQSYGVSTFSDTYSLAGLSHLNLAILI